MIEQQVKDDEWFMTKALEQAQLALEAGEIPVGAVVVAKDKIIARSHNLTDVTAHAEMQAITSGTNSLGGKYLNECTLYVTLEPCVMCAGAIGWSQLGRLVYGASDDKRGFMRFAPNALHPKTKVTKGVMEEECKTIIQNFFRSKR